MRPRTGAGEVRPWASRFRATSALALVLVVALGACSPGEAELDDDGKVVTAGELKVLSLERGHCLKPDRTQGNQGSEIETINAVPCEEEHTQQVFAIARAEGDTYPGSNELAAIADRACLDRLQSDPELGLTLDDGVFFSYLLPTFDGWTRTNDPDRSIVCVLVFPYGPDSGVTGSVFGDPPLDPPLVRQVPAPPMEPGPESDADTAQTDASAGGEA